MSKQATKEFTNIDFTNTAAYKTIKALNKEGIFAEHKLPVREYGQLQRLRKLDRILKTEKGIKRIINTMSRQIVRQQDKHGRSISKEVLTIGGEFKGYSWTDEEFGMSFEEGYYRKPKIVKM